MGITLYRGDTVICSAPGNYGKPRPAILIQSDFFNPTHGSITVCPITSHLIDAPLFRIPLTPTKQNGIKLPSQIMIDKITTLKVEKINKKAGKLSQSVIDRVEIAIKLWLNL